MLFAERCQEGLAMSTLERSGALAAGLWLLLLGGPAAAQCPPGVGCTEYLGEGSKGSYFRILVPEPWDGDLFLVNHGLELDPSTIAPHKACRNDHAKACSSDDDCDGGVCNEISTLGFEFLLPLGKAVGASTLSQTSWSAFASRYDLKDMVKFVRRKGPGKPRRIIVSGFSGGGAVTVDATMRLAPGRWIHGAIPLCSCSGGGLPSMDAATDLRLAYDYVCKDVPSGSFSSLPDVGDPLLSLIDFGITVNTCMGALIPSGDPLEAAAQAARLATFSELTGFSGSGANLLNVLGFSLLAMGDFVDDPERLNGRRIGWNEGIDYASVLGGEAAQAFDDAVPRFAKGPGRRKMQRCTEVDFTRGPARRVNYPILSFSGREDFICLPEFQKLYDDAATLGGKDHAMIWGSAPGHCAFTPFELRAVVLEYLDWLDSYGTASPDEPTTEEVLERCLALPDASPEQCNFDPAFSPPALADRVPPRADWPDAAKNPLP
jgi:hypothetical protein